MRLRRRKAVNPPTAKLVLCGGDLKMREILFRGKRKYNGEWIYGNLAIRDNVKRWEFFIGQNSLGYEVIPETVGQFTGLTDKNGTKIFEGDIVDVAYDIGYVGISAERTGAFIVVFDNGCFMKRNEKGLFHFIPSDKCKVIGNIHDNPELLKEAEQK